MCDYLCVTINSCMYVCGMNRRQYYRTYDFLGDDAGQRHLVVIDVGRRLELARRLFRYRLGVRLRQLRRDVIVVETLEHVVTETRVFAQ